MPYDSKIAVVAKRCEARRGDVAAVWLAVLDFASQQDDRGSVKGIDPEEIGVSLDYEVEYVSRIIEAFEQKGMIAAGRVSAWERRQVNRERDDDSKERVQEYRKRQKGHTDNSETPLSRHVTPRNANETPASRDVTPCNAPDKTRLEETKQEATHTQTARACVSPKAADLDGQTSPLFEELWKRWPRKEQRDRAYRDWLSFVTLENESAVMACADRYLASDEVARGVVKQLYNFLEQQHRDGWAGDWPPPRPTEDRSNAALLKLIYSKEQ